MYVVWFLLSLSSTIYLQHTIHDVAEQAPETGGAQVFATFQHLSWIHIYSEKCSSARFLLFGAWQWQPTYRSSVCAVTVWFFVDNDTRFSRIFMMPNCSSGASIKYDAILPRVPIFCFFALNFQASNTIKLSWHSVARVRSIYCQMHAGSLVGSEYCKKRKTMKKIHLAMLENMRIQCTRIFSISIKWNS